MKTRRLCVLSLLVVFAVVVSSAQIKRPGFIATFPSSVLPNSQAKLCIRFENLKSQVDYTIEDDEPHSFEQIQTSSSPSEPQKCIEIGINDSLNQTKVKQIKVYGKATANNDDYEFNETKKFTYKRVNYFTLIETDKPVYKPGDKVRIRLLTIDYKLRPQPIEYKNIFILDPTGSRVNQWLNEESKNGLLDLELPISKEPNLGKWVIQVVDTKQNTKSAFFEVKKYVLPKFEVLVKHKPKVSSSEQDILVNVCSKYSHGGFVKGSYELSAFTKRFYNDEIIAALNQTKQGKGCVEFNVTLKEIGVEPRNYISMIYFEAKVVESSTDISANSSSTAHVAFNNFEADFIEPAYYKPGFPINFKIFVKTGDDQPFKEEKVEVHLMKSIETFYKQSFQTDQNGYLEFTYDPTSCSSECQRGALTESPETIAIKLVQFKDSGTGATSKSHYIRPFSSLKNSYLQIYKPENAKKNAFACKIDEIRSKMVLRTNREFNGNLYFQLQTKSAILGSGHFNVESSRLETDSTDVDVKIQLLKSNSFELNKTSKYPTEETKLKKNSVCEVKVEKIEAKKSDKWYYDSEVNECDRLTIKAAKTTNSFETKKDCEDQCRFKEFYYDMSGKPVASIRSKRTAVNEKQFEMSLKVDERMSPEFKILLFTIVDGEIVADSMSFEIEKCLSHPVNLSLQESSLRVGRRASFEIKSEPNSICALTGIDKSVSFMGARNSIDLNKVFDSLADLALIVDSENDYKSNEESGECSGNQPIPMPRPVPRRIPMNNRERRSMIYYPSRPFISPNSLFDSTKAFKDGRVIYLSDFVVTKECTKITPIYMGAMEMSRVSINGPPEPFSAPIDSKSPKKSEISVSEVASSVTERQFFPETWLWNIEISDENGLIRKKEKVPDTITDWLLDAYCVSNSSGLGISETKTLKVFQPLFVSINLPYSVVRGESFPVKATIFNYENTCVPIKIEIITDRNLVLDSQANKFTKVCICPDDELTHRFNLKAVAFENENGIRITVKVSNIDEYDICTNRSLKVTKVVPFVDSESRNILVEPEGIPKEHVESSLVILNSNGSSGIQSFETKLPANIVAKSSRVYLTIIGDSMGAVLSNLDNLVQQPTGCGEQNMVKFAPIISVARYLLKTYQMTNKMSDLTQNYLKIGYQRQLTYRHNDGGFSAFGPSSSKTVGGGTWLTAFVLRSLADAYMLDHIKIDENDLRTSARMLLGTQDPNEGSFKQVGAPLYSKALAGGLGTDRALGLSAYVLVSLLKTFDALKQSDELVNDDSKAKIDKAFKYLKKSVQSDLEKADTYSLAVVLYAFKLGRYEKALIERVEKELDKRAIKENGLMYWKESTPNNNQERSQESAADLEITAYIMLSKLFNMDKRALADLVPISRWITSKRNSLGGFYSTQDTVVALDALSEFAQLSYSKNTNLKLAYYLNSGKSVVFVNELNRLLLRRIRLDRFIESGNNTLSFEADGLGTVLVQAVFKYNIQSDNKSSTNNDFEFSAFSSSASNSEQCSRSILHIKAKYVGAKESSSMAIVAVRLPSGWEADESSIQKLTNKVDLKRFEIDENKISLYFDQLTKSEKEFEFEIVKKFDIKDTKPGLLSVYDYYEPMEDALVQQFEISDDCNNDK